MKENGIVHTNRSFFVVRCSVVREKREEETDKMPATAPPPVKTPAKTPQTPTSPFKAPRPAVMPEPKN